MEPGGTPTLGHWHNLSEPVGSPLPSRIEAIHIPVAFQDEMKLVSGHPAAERLVWIDPRTPKRTDGRKRQDHCSILSATASWSDIGINRKANLPPPTHERPRGQRFVLP